MAGEKLRLEILTIERRVYTDDVDLVLAPGIRGQLGILPKHAPLITALDTGELLARKDGQEEAIAISGGFMEVLPDRVIVLADTAERAEEIDVQRAQEARDRAERLIHRRGARSQAPRRRLATASPGGSRVRTARWWMRA